MNIACTACSARYGVADDKLIGKRVRITCKRCGTVLIVDGNTNPPTVTASTSIAPSPPASPPPPAAEPRPAPAVAEPPFTVLFADGRQEQADVAQIVRFYRAGQLGVDSLVWREGMADWTDPWDVEEIGAAFKRMGYSRPAPPPEPAATAPARDEFEEEATQVVDSNPHHRAPEYDDGGDTNVVSPARLGGAAGARHAASQQMDDDDDEDPTRVGPLDRGSTKLTAAAREKQRARRASSQPPRETRRSEPARPLAAQPAEPREDRPSARARAARAAERPREDLFAHQAYAGSEEDQQAHAAAVPQEYDAPRLTGARNESSVLFSLDSLLKQEQKPETRPVRPARRERESVLVDTGSSLPAGGGIAPALAAPDFTAPITAPPPALASLHPYAEDLRPRSSRAWLYVVVLVAFGGAGAVGWRTGALRELLGKAGVAPPSSATNTVSPAPSASEASSAAEPTSSTSTSAATSASAAPSASAASSATSEAKTPAAAGTHGVTHATTHEAAAHEHEATTHEAPAHEAFTHEASAHEAPAHEASEHEAPAAAPASTGASTPFDTAAAKEALTAASGNAASCKEMGGPTGNGRVSITFAPSGRPTSVAVTGDLAGTTVGSCVARLFRGVHVPAFAGDSVTVAKSFSIE